jgi:hypothetical protein
VKCLRQTASTRSSGFSRIRWIFFTNTSSNMLRMPHPYLNVRDMHPAPDHRNS